MDRHSKQNVRRNKMDAMHFVFVFLCALVSISFIIFALVTHPSVEQYALGANWNQCRTETGTTVIPGSATSVNVSLATPITDTSQAFLLLDVAGQSGISPEDDHMTTGYIASSTTLTFERGFADPTQAEVSYSMVECFHNEFSVQRGEIFVASASVSNTASVTAVDTSRTMVLVSGRTSRNANDEREALFTGEMQDATTVLVERAGSAADGWARYEVVEFSVASGATVQTNEVTFGNGASTTDAISSVDPSRSWLYCSWDTANNTERASSVGCDLTNATTVTFNRYQSTNYTNRIRYYVVQFPTDTVTVQRGSEAFTGNSCSLNTQCDHDITIPNPVSSVTKAFSFVTNTVRATGTGYPRNRWIDSLLNTSTIRTSNWRSSGATADDNVKYWQVVEFPNEPIVTLEAYRWFANDDSTDVGVPAAAQDTPPTLVSTDPIRLRVLIGVADANVKAGDFDFKLQFAPQSGSCDSGFSGESYIDVTGLTDIAFYNNSPGDGVALTANASDPVGVGSTVHQTYEEANNFSVIADINSGEFGLWDFSLVDNGAPNSTTYCFRVVQSSGDVIDGYTLLPELTTFSGNYAPTGMFNSIVQRADGSQLADVSLEFDDGNDDDLKALVEFDTDAACDGPWTKATLREDEGATADSEDSGGPPSVLNVDAYQIGSSSGERIVTSSGSNTVNVVWDIGADAPSVDATYCLRVTANDDVHDQFPPSTLSTAIDTLAPVSDGASLSPSSGTAIEGDVITVEISMTGETGLTATSGECYINGNDLSGDVVDNADGTYTIQFAPIQGDTSWSAGFLPLSCSIQDAFGNSDVVSAWTDGNTLEGDISDLPTGGGGTSCPTISNISFTINGGAATTTSRDVQLVITQAYATRYIASESIQFLGADYKTITGSIPFTISEGAGEKTVYLQLKNNCNTSAIVFDTINYVPSSNEPSTLPDQSGGSETPIEPITPTVPVTPVPPTAPAVVPEDVYEDLGGFIVARSFVIDDSPTGSSFRTNLGFSEDVYAGGSLTFTSGPLAGETRTILGFDGPSRTISVDPAFTQAPQDGDHFTIVRSTAVAVVPTAPTTPVATPSLPVAPVPIAVLPLSDEVVVRSLNTIDQTLDHIKTKADEQGVSEVRADLEAAANDILNTISASSSITLSVDTVADITTIHDSDIASILDIQNKIADLRALSVVARRLIEQGNKAPVSEVYMTFGSVKIKYLLANPLSDPQTFHLATYLPTEVQPEHVFSGGGFTLAYDGDTEAYQATVSVDVPSDSLVVRSIELRDVWIISDDTVRALSEDAASELMAVTGTRYEPEATALVSHIDQLVEQILAKQNASYTSPQEHILVYRENVASFNEARADLDQLQTLASRAQYGAFGGPSTLLTWLIALVILLTVLFSGGFVLLWEHERHLAKLVRSRKTSSRAKRETFDHNIFEHLYAKPFRYWRIAMLFLALISAFAAAYFFGIELDRMTVEQAIRIATLGG